MSSTDKVTEALSLRLASTRPPFDRPASALHLVSRLREEQGGEIIHTSPALTSVLIKQIQLNDGSFWPVPSILHVHQHGVEVRATFAWDVPVERSSELMAFASASVREYGLAFESEGESNLLQLKGWTDSLELSDAIVLLIKLAEVARKLHESISA